MERTSATRSANVREAMGTRGKTYCRRFGFFEMVTEDVVRSGLGLVFLRELLTATTTRTEQRS